MSSPPSEASLQQLPVMRFALWLDRFYVRGAHRLHVLNACPVPPAGPAILACNHISALDPVLIQAACSRPIVWMIASEYYHLPPLRWFFQGLAAIPVHRSGRDLAATREALRALDAGRVLGLFPEGRISRTLDILPFQRGIGMLTVDSGAPLIPACIEGTMRGQGMIEAFLRPNEAWLAFGDPLPPSKEPTSSESFAESAVAARNATLEIRAHFPQLRRLPTG